MSDTQSEPDGQISEAGSGALNAETTQGGADAVPDTPDGVAEDYTERETEDTSIDGAE